ncbi:MAG: YceI family protein [Gemmatimonadales bacterium]
MKRLVSTITAIALVAGAIYACQPRESAEASTGAVSASDAPSAASNTTLPQVSPNSKAAVRYVTAATGNAARYRIREQLVGVDLPNDAIGETKTVSGVIAADAKGNVIPAESKFIIDVTGLTSDKQRRDGFVRGRVLETEQYPTVTLVPTSLRGLSVPLPKSGSKTFDIIGDLTVRGKTRPTTWKVTAQFQPTGVTGSAKTAFTFNDFEIQQPRVPVVLSVADTIKLELDFSMVPEGKK